MTYHDPCYLGRYNGVYDAPRDAVSAMPGANLVEMRRNRNKSFCCGGGGGRMFMEEQRGSRINQARVQEAIDTGAELLCAACPFCMTMFEDGIRGVGADDTFQVLDLAEIVAGSMARRMARLRPLASRRQRSTNTRSSRSRRGLPSYGNTVGMGLVSIRLRMRGLVWMGASHIRTIPDFDNRCTLQPVAQQPFEVCPGGWRDVDAGKLVAVNVRS
ncbi:MAG: (Fe-S)-binding protein [Thermomicrobiales bacterium]